MTSEIAHDRKYGVLIPFSQPGLRLSVEELDAMGEMLSGLGNVEFWFENPTEDKKYVDPVLRRLGDVACTVHAPFVDFSLGTPVEEYAISSLVRLRQTIDISQELGAKNITVHPGTYAVYEDKRAAMYRLVSRVRSAQEYSEIPVTLENLKAKSSGVQRNIVTSN